MLDLLFIALGAGLVLLTLFDVIASTLGTGSGPVLRRVIPYLWRASLWIHRRTGSHRTLARLGKSLVVFSLGLWIMLLWVGWTLIFSGAAFAVVDLQTGEPVGWLDRMYFVGSTVTSLGRGDLAPVGAPWNLLNILAVMTGTFLITFGISYLIPVIQAETRRRATSLSVHAMGSSPVRILTQAWRDDGLATLEQELRGMVRDLAQLQQDHLAYPMLHYMHAERVPESISVQMAVLDETLTILRHGFEDPPVSPFLLDRLSTTLTYFLESLTTAQVVIADEMPPPADLGALRDAGLPVVDDFTFRERVGGISERRRLILSLLENDGWGWQHLDGGERHMLERAEQALAPV